MSESGAPVRKLLVVEDDPGLQAQLKWAYEDYQVLIAGDHDAAIDLLRAEEPDVVTLACRPTPTARVRASGRSRRSSKSNPIPRSSSYRGMANAPAR